MNENELKSLEVYNEKFKEDPTSFNDFQANDYIKLLKKSDNNEEAIEVGKTFMSQCPNLRGYLNQYGYALYQQPRTQNIARFYRYAVHSPKHLFCRI